MILSVSRRTDIPNYYSDWFFNRINEGFLYVRNPMNVQQVSKVALSPQVIDCIVFWTKNPAPMLARLDELEQYHYLFQFTITGYGADLEPGLCNQKEEVLNIFRELSDRIGNHRMVWRYDPIVVNETYTLEYHRKAFGELAKKLEGYTTRCMVSLVDFYEKNKIRMHSIHVKTLTELEKNELISDLAAIGAASGIQVETCCEDVSAETGVRKGSCIDRTLIESIVGSHLKSIKGKALREGCMCMESVEVGSYDTCQNGCVYCYANNSAQRVAENAKYYDPNSPILCGEFYEDDIRREKKMISLREDQIELWDFLEVKANE